MHSHAVSCVIVLSSPFLVLRSSTTPILAFSLALTANLHGTAVLLWPRKKVFS